MPRGTCHNRGVPPRQDGAVISIIIIMTTTIVITIIIITIIIIMTPKTSKQGASRGHIEEPQDPLGDKRAFTTPADSTCGGRMPDLFWSNVIQSLRKTVGRVFRAMAFSEPATLMPGRLSQNLPPHPGKSKECAPGSLGMRLKPPPGGGV